MIACPRAFPPRCIPVTLADLRGIPVEGPPRMTFTDHAGNLRHDRVRSLPAFREKPGRLWRSWIEPRQRGPMIAHMEAISSPSG